MKKPELKDFGLTQREVDWYSKQKRSFDDAYRKHQESNEKITTLIVWLISTVFVFIVTLMCDPTVFKDNAGLFILVPIGAFIFPGLMILSMLNGSFRFLDKEKEIKAQYFSEDIEQHYAKYQKAVSEYEAYVRKCSVDFWNSLDGLRFEREVAKLFQEKGYDATVTSATSDGGVDVILKKGGERIAVQCKHHARPVGPNDVRALQGVVASQNYSKGIFVSLNGYTSSVRYEVRNGSVPLELLELSDLLKMASGMPETRIRKPDIPPKTTPMSRPKIADNLSIIHIPMLGDTVTHKIFGEGEITKTTPKQNGEIYITVKFDQCVKDFVFPSAFENHLTFNTSTGATKKDHIGKCYSCGNDLSFMGWECGEKAQCPFCGSTFIFR